MKENDFTIEQLEKIIDEAPGGAEFYTPGYAAEYRKITGQNAYYGFVDNEWMEAFDKSLSIERINKGFNLSKLQRQLDEMKIKESTQETRMTVKEFLASGRNIHIDDVVEANSGGECVIYKGNVEAWNNKSDDRNDQCFVISAKELQPELDNTAKQVESLGSAMAMSECDIEDALDNIPVYSKEVKETAYDEGMRNCVKDIAKIIGLNFPADVGYANLVDEVDLFIDKIDGRMGNSYRDKLIKALGYIDHHLSTSELIARVSDMRKEYNNIKLSGDSSEWNNGDSAYVENSSYAEIVFIGLSRNNNVAICECITESRSVIMDKFFVSELLKEKPLTPEQKQQKIDEQNGELLFNMEDKLWNDLLGCSASYWSDAADESKKVYTELAKQVSFKGKLESI